MVFMVFLHQVEYFCIFVLKYAMTQNYQDMEQKLKKRDQEESCIPQLLSN